MDLNKSLAQIEERICKIEARNRRVEADKAWETSSTRAAFITVSTYILIFIFMKLIGDTHPFLNAFVASVGYLISNATYGFLKKWWLAKKNNRN